MLSPTVPPGIATQRVPENRLIELLRRRGWPMVVSVLFIGLGLGYSFRWASVVQHHPSAWTSPEDLWGTLADAVLFTHGHFGTVYAGDRGFYAFPGILILLAPVAALSGSLQTVLVQIKKAHHLLVHPQILTLQSTYQAHTDVLRSGGNVYVPHPQVFLLLAPYELLLSCSALFACDALAQRLQVGAGRRAMLCLVEAVLLWNVSVQWGHPEDAVAVALAVYAFVFALDARWNATGWLFGLAIAMQPLVIVVLPILLVMGGRQRVGGLLVRSAVPAIVVVIPSLASNFHATFHALTTQPAFPFHNHRTPWTDLAPKVSGRGANASLGGGPVRVVALALAAALGWWALRWRDKPAMLAWAVALALALRCYAESVMVAYYVWPALAVATVVAARHGAWRFRAVVAAAVATSVVAQWRIGEWPWWIAVMAGLTGALVLATRPAALDLAAVEVPSRPPVSAPRGRSRPVPSQKKKRKAARTDRKRSARR
jgi:hypothetical protein